MNCPHCKSKKANGARNMRFVLEGSLGTALKEKPIFKIQSYVWVNRCASCNKFFVLQDELDGAVHLFVSKLNRPGNDPFLALDDQVKGAVGIRRVGEDH